MLSPSHAPLEAAPPDARVEHRLPAVPASIAEGRRRGAEVGDRVLSHERAADLQLLLSEVLTNAVRHGGGPEVLLALTPKAELLCVQVTDGGAGFVPTPRAMSAERDEGGFGLFLVERLTDRWGMTRERGQTRVWFELRYDA